MLCWLTLIIFRVAASRLLSMKLTRAPLSLLHASAIILKDYLQVAIWAASFLGNRVEWRGQQFEIARGGRLVPVEPP